MIIELSDRIPELGTSLPPLTAAPTEITLFRFSAVTWNPHRIHYDSAYASSEGYPNVLVQSHLHGAFIAECVLRWSAAHWRIAAFSWQNRRAAYPGDRLTVTGTVDVVSSGSFECSLQEANHDGEVCATGRATLILTTKGE